MPKHFTKLSKFGGQYRLTIPKALIIELGWEDVEFVIMEHASPKAFYVRRFIDVESLRTELEADSAKPR